MNSLVNNKMAYDKTNFYLREHIGHILRMKVSCKVRVDVHDKTWDKIDNQIWDFVHSHIFYQIFKYEQ